MTDSRTIEHLQSQDKGLARASSRPKTSGSAAPIHPGFQNRTSTDIGAPTKGLPPDASSPLPTDPTRQGKMFAVPQVTRGMSSRSDRGSHNPDNANRVMGEAARHIDDYAQDLHAILPSTTSED